MNRRIHALVAALLATLGVAACVETKSAQNPGDTPTSGVSLAATEVDGALARAASAAQSVGLPAAIAVCDREGEVLGVFVTAPATVNGTLATVSEGNIQSAISKATTAAFFQSDGEAFTTRTAFFIVQGHFPPGVLLTPAGPLFGVQDSSLASSDAKQGAYDQTGRAVGGGISGEFGGVPLFKAGTPIGGIGVETADVLVTDGFGALTLASKIQNDSDEAIARAGSSGFDAPFPIQATNIFVGGISFPFFGPEQPLPGGVAPTLATLAPAVGALDPRFPVRTSPLAPELTFGFNTSGLRPQNRYVGRVVSRAQPTFLGSFTNVDRAATVAIDSATLAFTNVPVVPVTMASHAGVLGDVRFPSIDAIEPPPAEGGLTVGDVNAAIDAAVANAAASVAGIRVPRGRNVVVHVAIVDRRGNILGVFRMGDGTLFSFDIAVQKARTSAFFSTDGSEGLPALAVSARGIGFLSQPFYAPGIDGTAPGPLAGLRELVNRGEIPVETNPGLTVVFPPPRPPSDGTTDEDLFDPGFQKFDDFHGAAPAELAAVRAIFASQAGINILADRPDTTPGFVSPGLQNGLQTFPGGVPLYKNGKLVGAIGVSGDGVDQDDDAAYMGASGFPPPAGTRLDEADEGTIRTVLEAKVHEIAVALDSHPDLRIKNVYAPVANTVQGNVIAGFARGLQGLTIPYTKLPRNPQTR